MHVGRYEDARVTLGQALDGGRALGDETCIGYASGELMWLDTIVGEGALFEGLPDRVSELEAELTNAQNTIEQMEDELNK